MSAENVTLVDEGAALMRPTSGYRARRQKLSDADGVGEWNSADFESYEVLVLAGTPDPVERVNRARCAVWRGGEGKGAPADG